MSRELRSLQSYILLRPRIQQGATYAYCITALRFGSIVVKEEIQLCLSLHKLEWRQFFSHCRSVKGATKPFVLCVGSHPQQIQLDLFLSSSYLVSLPVCVTDICINNAGV